MLLNYFISVEALSQKINLSVAQTYKSLNTINKVLSDFDIKLIFTRDKSRSNFQGLETNIRLFLFYYYWSVFKGVVWPFRDSLAYLQDIDVPICNVSQSQKMRLKYYQTICAWRILYRNKLIDLDPDFLEVIQLFNTIHPIKFSVDMNISGEALAQEESYFGFLCRLFIYNTDTTAQKLDIATAFIESDLPLSESCTFILDRVYAAYDIKPKREDYLFSYYALLIALTSITYLSIDNSEWLENDQNLSNLGTDFADFPQIEIELSELAQQLFLEAPYLCELKSKGFFTYIVYLFYFFIDSSKKSQQLKICIQYSKNQITTAEMKKSLSSFFSSESIVFIDESEQSDILISDCYEKDYPNENFFYFDNPLDKNEWQSLLKYVSNKLYKTIFYKQI
ncbi:helix-turn-helix domain-containing protein [Enterococcus ureasiticus]